MGGPCPLVGLCVIARGPSITSMWNRAQSRGCTPLSRRFPRGGRSASTKAPCFIRMLRRERSRGCIQLTQLLLLWWAALFKPTTMCCPVGGRLANQRKATRSSRTLRRERSNGLIQRCLPNWIFPRDGRSGSTEAKHSTRTLKRRRKRGCTPQLQLQLQLHLQLATVVQSMAMRMHRPQWPHHLQPQERAADRCSRRALQRTCRTTHVRVRRVDCSDRCCRAASWSRRWKRRSRRSRRETI